MEEIYGYCIKCDKQTKLTVVNRNESVNFKGIFWLLLRCDECKECFGLTVDNNLVYTQSGDTGILNIKPKSYIDSDTPFELPEYGYIKDLKKILQDAKRSGFTMYNLKVTGVNNSESDVTISINFE